MRLGTRLRLGAIESNTSTLSLLSTSGMKQRNVCGYQCVSLERRKQLEKDCHQSRRILLSTIGISPEKIERLFQRILQKLMLFRAGPLQTVYKTSRSSLGLGWLGIIATTVFCSNCPSLVPTRKTGDESSNGPLSACSH